MKTRISNPFRSIATITSALSVAWLIQFTTPTASAADGTWTGISGNWSDTTTPGGVWTGGIVADGADFTANFTGVDITAEQAITLDADRTIGNITFTDATTSSNNLLITGANLLTVDVATGAPVINVTQADRTLTINSVIAGSDGLRKTGAGALTLNGSAVNTFTGGLNANGGILTLDYNNLVTPTDLVDATNALQINNGALTITGKSTANTSQTFGGTTLGAGVNTININRNGASGDAILNLGALTTTAGSTTTIIPNTVWNTGVPSTTEKVFITSVNGNALPVSGKVNVNASLFYRQSANAGGARWVSVDSAGQLQAIPATIPILTNATAPDLNIAYQIQNADITLTNTAMAIHGLVLNSNSNPRTLTLAADGTLTLNGILGVQATNQTNIVPGTGASNLIIGPERNLVINMDNSAPLSITAPIADNGGGASAVTIASTAPAATTPGIVTFGGANTYTGATAISRGTLSLNHVNALQNTSGITMANGTTLRSTIAGVVVNAPIGITTAATIQNNSPTSSNTTTQNLTLGGAITGTGNVEFTADAGGNCYALTILNAASSYVGNTTITTSLSNQMSFVRLGIDNALPITTRLTLAGISTTATRYTLLDLRGYNQEIAGLTGASTTNRPLRIINGTSATPTGTLTINTPASTSFTFSGQVGVAGTPGTLLGPNFNFEKKGAGTQILSGSNGFTGTTTLSGGVLSLGNANALGGNNPGVNGTSGITMTNGATLRTSLINGAMTVYAPITTSGNVTINAPSVANTFQTFNEFMINGAIGGTGNVTFNNTVNDNEIFTVTLNAAGDYSGTTTIDNTAGTNGQMFVKLGIHDALPTTTVLNILGQAGSGSGRGIGLNLFGFNQTLAGLTNTSANLRAQQVVNSNVSAAATLTIDGSTDTTFSGNLGTNSANFSVNGTAIPGSTNGNNFGLTKSGNGIFTISGANSYTGATAINGGTLALGAANVLPNTTPVSIGAATLNAATTGTEAAGTLDITGAATINLASGASLVFADSSGVNSGTWSGTLNLTGTFVSGSSLNFGSSTGLSAQQLSKISATGFTNFALDTEGDLIATAVSGSTFADWLLLNAPATGFVTDSDNDGLSNGVENVLGSNPNTYNAGLTEISSTANSVVFKHTLNPTIAGDVTYGYEWSTDMVEWKTHNQTNTGGTTATISASTPVSGVVTVTITITGGPSAKLFGRLVAVN